MIGRTPLVVVTLPSRSVESARRDAATAAEAGADGAEIRLDRLPSGELARLSELFPPPIPLLATLRSRIEGGDGPDDVAARARILAAAAVLPFRWIDLEYDRDLELLGQLPPAVGAVLSTHLPAGAGPAELERRLRQGPPAGALRKIVLPASVGTLIGRVLPAVPPPGEIPLLIATTGPSGPLLRAWSKRLGMPLVFASLPQGPPGRRGPLPVEPGQIPVDRLRWFFDNEGEAPIFGIAGHPVAHSASPFLHSGWLRHEGRRGLYVPLDFASDEEFVEALPILAAHGFKGLNVTHPFKETAFAAASRVARGAEACGVANCLTFRGDEVEAENTDLAAILRRLEELRTAGTWNGRTVTVLGAGGAARATLAAARELGASRHLVARRPESTRTLAETFGAGIGSPDKISAGDLVVHATDVGRAGAEELQFPLASLVDASTHVVDWVYRPDDPVIRTTVESVGATYEDGWRLLVYQAAESFAVWWDDPPAEDEVTAAIEVGR